MKITVVVPVRNEAHSIRALLDSLLNQTLKPAEIVIADGGSTDTTIDIVSEYVKDGACIRLIRGGPALPGRGRNLAAAEASSDWLAFVDAGAQPELTWLQFLVEAAQRDGADVVFGAYEPFTDTLFKECAAIAYVPPPAQIDEVLMRPRSIASALMRKSVWQTVGGFPEDLRSAEDLIFLDRVQTAGVRIAYAAKALVRWDIQPTFWKTFRRFVLYAHHNIRAGLWRSWNAKILLRYGLLLLLLIPACVLGGRALLFWASIWLLMLLLRAVIAIRKNDQSYPAGLGRNLLRTVVLVPMLAIIDGATITGTLKWLITDRAFSIATTPPAELSS